MPLDAATASWLQTWASWLEGWLAGQVMKGSSQGVVMNIIIGLIGGAIGGFSGRNSLGLLSEDLDPESHELWGNFPQTYSLVGIIHAAQRLSCDWEDGL